QIYADGVLGEESAEVQEIVVRLATAASLMGEREPAERMLEDSWRRVVGGGDGYEEEWQRRQVCRIARVLGPLVTDKGDYERGLEVYGEALQASRWLDDRVEDVGERDRLRAETAGFVASLGETFALKGDYESARLVLQGLLAEIRERNREAGEAGATKVDQWTCLDAIVMLDLAQVVGQQGKHEESGAWANSALAVAAKHGGVRACDNCYTHSVHHLGTLAENSARLDDALTMYRRALEHGRKTKTGNLEQIKSSISRLEPDEEAKHIIKKQ
ncbi:hypothetical protein LPJ75_005699, partial [Coemansia sp. RSA 2598]